MKRINLKSYIYLIPSFIFLITFIYYGIFYNFYISFFKWDGLSSSREFVGTGNYIKLFSDGRFLRSLSNTAIIAIATIVFCMFIGYLIAVILNFAPKRFQNVYKAIFFIPHILAQIVVAYNFRLAMYDPNFGFLNKALRSMGLDFLTQNWLGDIRIVLISIIIAYIFMMTGFAMIIYYTSMLTVPYEVLEAAVVDGAGFLNITFKIFFPILRSTHLILIVFSVVATTKLFELVWVMTEGGPGGYSEILSTNIFRQSMIYYNQGYASTISSIILIIVLLISFIILNYQKKYTV